MAQQAVSYPCPWCGSSLNNNSVWFCPNCNGPNTWPAKFLYSINFAAKNLFIPAAIGLFTFILTARQQEAALIVASRQKLADGLVEYGKTYGDYHSATRQILLLSSTTKKTVPAAKLQEAVLKLDLAMASFGTKLIPFEEFARRTKICNDLSSDEPTLLQKVWDDCYVYPYWVGSAGSAAYFDQIVKLMAKCNNATCPTDAAAQIFSITEKIYQGYCKDEKPSKMVNFVWFHRELRRITVQASSGATGPFDLRI